MAMKRTFWLVTTGRPYGGDSRWFRQRVKIRPGDVDRVREWATAHALPGVEVAIACDVAPGRTVDPPRAEAAHMTIGGRPVGSWEGV